MFAVIFYRTGLRFRIAAKTRAEACAKVMRMVGKTSLPWHVEVYEI